MKERLNIQLLTAAVLSIGGLAMLFCGVFIDPEGQIHESLLIGFGEVATFAGSIMGVDYSYRSKMTPNDPKSRLIDGTNDEIKISQKLPKITKNYDNHNTNQTKGERREARGESRDGTNIAPLRPEKPPHV